MKDEEIRRLEFFLVASLDYRLVGSGDLIYRGAHTVAASFNVFFQFLWQYVSLNICPEAEFEDLM